MPVFKVLKKEYRTIIRSFTVQADDEDEAIDIVQRGDVPEDSEDDGEAPVDEFSVIKEAG